MRDLQVGFIDSQVVVEQNIDIDGTIRVSRGGKERRREGVSRFLLAAEVALDTLSSLEELAGSKRCLDEYHAIQEFVLRLEAPRLCLDERGLANHLAYPLAYQRYGMTDILFLISEITPQPQINLMNSSLTSHFLPLHGP